VGTVHRRSPRRRGRRGRRRDPHRPRAQPCREVDDRTPGLATTSDVADRIGAALQRHAQLQTRGITVAVHGSTVTLKGQVDNWADRNAAQEAAWAAPGVNKVVNEILIQAQG